MKSKERNIRQETIEKSQKYLNHVKVHLMAHNGELTGKQKTEIANIYQQPYSMFSAAVRLGYFEHVAESKFKTKFNNFEPIHARNMITEQYRAHEQALIDKQKQAEKDSKKKPISKTTAIDYRKDQVIKGGKTHATVYELAPETIPPRNTQRDIRKANKKRTISIFWGLLKFNY